jgi:hypothetical protein
MLFPLVYLRKFFLIMVCLDIVLYMHDLVNWYMCCNDHHVWSVPRLLLNVIYLEACIVSTSHKLYYDIYSIGPFCDAIDILCLDQCMLWSPLVLRSLECAKCKSFKYLMHNFRGSTHNLCLLRLTVSWVILYSLKVEKGRWARNGAIGTWVPPQVE